MATVADVAGAYVSASGGAPGKRKRREPIDVAAAVQSIVAAETAHEPLLDDLLIDLDWLVMLSILTAIEDELGIRIFPDFSPATVQAVLEPLESVSDVVALAEKTLAPQPSDEPDSDTQAILAGFPDE